MSTWLPYSSTVAAGLADVLLQASREAPLGPRGDGYTDAIVKVVISLSILILGLVISAKWLPRVLPSLKQQSESSRIRVSDRLSLGRNKTLYLVEVDDSRILIGECAGTFVRLGDVSSAPFPAPGRSSGKGPRPEGGPATSDPPDADRI